MSRLQNEETSFEQNSDSSVEIETVTYTPNIDDEELECEEDVYDVLKYYDMDHPSQTVSILNNNSLVVGTNPEVGDPVLKTFDINKWGKEDFESKICKTDIAYNRIRTSRNINCVSDNTFDIYDDNLQKINSVSYENVCYGLCCVNDTVTFSHTKGLVSTFTDRVVDTFNLHSGSIESINCYNSLLFSCSSDMSAKVTDLRSKNTIFCRKEKYEINSIDSNKENMFVYGDDNGTIKLVDLRMPDADVGIFWHKSSISMISWKDTDVFVSASDEQVCIFDVTLEDDWEYEKYLLFVHQGQRYYKDICFFDNLVISTCVEGLCIFSPTSFL